MAFELLCVSFRGTLFFQGDKMPLNLQKFLVIALATLSLSACTKRYESPRKPDGKHEIEFAPNEKTLIRYEFEKDELRHACAASIGKARNRLQDIAKLENHTFANS